MGLLIDGPKGKQLKTLRLYAVDLTGNLYKGKIKPVHKLLSELLAAEKARAEGRTVFAAAPNAAVSAAPAASEEKEEKAEEVTPPAQEAKEEE